MITSMIENVNVPKLVAEQYDLVISLDTEWTLEVPIDDPPMGFTLQRIPEYPRKQRNQILSYQIVAVLTHTRKKAEIILYPTERLTISDIVVAACGLFDIKNERIRRQKGDKPQLRVCLLWHWGSAEVGALKDRDNLMSYKEEVISIGGGIVTLKPIDYTIYLDEKHKGTVTLNARDTQRLADTDSSLEALGEAIGFPKVDISPWSKARMDLLLEGDKDLYEKYAITDSRIALEWFFMTVETYKDVLHLDSIPVTTGAASAAGLKKFLGKDFEDAFCVKYNRKTMKHDLRSERAAFESFPTQCFKGGANQSYKLGCVKGGTVLDLDLSGAYGGAMGILPGIEWSKKEYVNGGNPWDLTDLMSFAIIRFRFPHGTKFPCLPVSTDNGLIYPLTCWEQEGVPVTGPEIHEALLMGAEIEIVKSMKFNTKELLTAGFVGYLAGLRRQYPDKSDPRNRAAKLFINSLYGKLAQGLQTRYTNEEIFSTQEVQGGKRMPRSSVTLPHAAATITGLVRAALSAMVLEASKLGTVLSATTDGIMLHVPDMTLEEPVKGGRPNLDPPRALLEACEKHPSIQLLMQGIQNIGNDSTKWLEVKYAGNEAYTVKTRLNWVGWNGETLHQATVGLDKREVTFQEIIDIREKSLTRFHTKHSLNKITDVTDHTALDITGYYSSSVVNLAPDWKRRFASDGSSVPFESMEEWRSYRSAVDSMPDGTAWPDMIEFLKDKRGTTEAIIRRGVLHRIALGVEGFRLPMSDRMACSMLGISNNAIAKLRGERMVYNPLPEHPEVDRIKTLLKLY